ncbi:aldo/keto reductase [Streptomyces sp. NBC_00377]|uniref:aldo/keto reductase n=1 Tax=unclassified Streptomyces TaxID=2593676 RepID=UPI002E1F6347|nr:MULTISPECIES: aldo/keto reductase [unclassified Streptomyces]
MPAVNQIQLSPLTSQAELRAYHQRPGIETGSWGPLGKGTSLLKDHTVNRLAVKYSRTTGQIVLRWHMDLGLVAIPKSTDPQRIKSNIDIFDFALAPEDVLARSPPWTGEPNGPQTPTSSSRACAATAGCPLPEARATCATCSRPG